MSKVKVALFRPGTNLISPPSRRRRLLLDGSDLFKKAQGSIISNLIGVRIVPEVNMHQLTELDVGYGIILSK